MSGRRELALAVLLCAAGAAVALLATRASWVVDVIPRPAPFPDERVTQTGGDLRPWLPALGWVALAGAGALLATGGALRRSVGGLLVVAGVGIGLGAAVPLAGAGVEAGAVGWRMLAAAGGLAVLAAGILALARSQGWPAMGSRYERAGPPRSRPRPDTPTDLWDALDRGEDPTG